MSIQTPRNNLSNYASHLEESQRKQFVEKLEKKIYKIIF